MKYQVCKSCDVDKNTGVVGDEYIRLTGQYAKDDYLDLMRLVVYEDFSTDNVYRFLTNDFLHEAITIAELYRERWQVELFFKWIKQHLRIKSFFGTSQNAVFTHIWIAVCDYLLLLIARKVYNIEQELYIFSKAIGLVLLEQIPLTELFCKIDMPDTGNRDMRQLSLFNSFA